MPRDTDKNTYMNSKRKVVRTGSSLAVTLPREVVAEFGLRAGDEVEVSVHPLVQRRASLYRALAK
jgi:antitoxin component of MazEF toxin-antitoxin module